MKNVLSLVLILIVISKSFSAFAGYQSRVSIKKMYGSSYINFGVDISPPATCDYFGRYFRFNATTPTGQNILAILIAAEVSNR